MNQQPGQYQGTVPVIQSGMVQHSPGCTCSYCRGHGLNCTCHECTKRHQYGPNCHAKERQGHQQSYIQGSLEHEKLGQGSQYSQPVNVPQERYIQHGSMGQDARFSGHEAYIPQEQHLLQQGNIPSERVIQQGSSGLNQPGLGQPGNLSGVGLGQQGNLGGVGQQSSQQRYIGQQGQQQYGGNRPF